MSDITIYFTEIRMHLMVFSWKAYTRILSKYVAPSLNPVHIKVVAQGWVITGQYASLNEIENQPLNLYDV